MFRCSILGGLKKKQQTDREKDIWSLESWPELLDDPREQVLYSRSARDLIALASNDASLIEAQKEQRPLLATVASGREELERALDDERRNLIRLNERRLERYITAAQDWVRAWPRLRTEIEGLPLRRAHGSPRTAASTTLRG